jgi:hypothetical protein
MSQDITGPSLFELELACMQYHQALREEKEALRQKLMQYSVYKPVKSHRGLQVFLENHVLAVWDFMSLLKRLLQSSSGVTVPWFPAGKPLLCRFIKEIVLGEESGPDARRVHQPFRTLSLRNKGMCSINGGN